MTDIVRLMHQAYPTRIPYTGLHGRYAKGMPPVLAKLAPRDFCEAVALGVMKGQMRNVAGPKGDGAAPRPIAVGS